MNYVKHLIRAFFLVLGSASIADAKLLKGIKTPGGTEFKLVDKADPKFPASWTHAEVKPTGKREHLVIEMDKDGIITNIIDSRTKKSLFEVDASGKWTIDNDGKVIDADDTTTHWILNYEDAPAAEERALKKFIRTHILDKGKGVLIGVPLCLLGAGFVAYKTVPSFKEGVDNKVTVASEFFKDFKNGKGNARRKAGIGLVLSLAASAGVFYAYEGHLPFCG